MIKFAYLLMGCLVPVFCLQADHLVSSPDGRIEVNVRLSEAIYYNLKIDGEEVMWYSPISMVTSKGEWGLAPELIDVSRTSEQETVHTVWGIRSEIKNDYNELEMNFRKGFSVVFRVYDDGVAYLLRSNTEGDLIVYNEHVEFRFLKNHKMVNLMLNSFSSSYEDFYARTDIESITQENLIGLPSLIDQEEVLLSIMEADVYDYPGMYLSKEGIHGRWNLVGRFARYPTKTKLSGTHGFVDVVTKRADYIAKTNGNRDFPWRVIGIARESTDLADSDLVYKLSRPSKIPTDWIKPGLVAWDWWNAMNLTGVDFETGINNESYKYFIDFAACNGIPYVIMDEGWSDQFDLMLPTSNVDMEFLTQYAREKGVGLILWCIAHSINRQYEQAFEQFEKWDIAGIKVDFVDRDDQLAIEFYEKIAREAAKHELLVDFHGASKPTGLHRTYPNVITFEAVRGNEYNKFSRKPTTPGHNIDLVYLRMQSGPMDYTPGAMSNVVDGSFINSFETPVVLGTRAHQLGMFVVYFSPLQMLCDAPTSYERYPDILQFLSSVPVSWDDTYVISGKLGKYVVIARRKGEDWYVGGLNDWDERDVQIDFSAFLSDGEYQATLFRDGVNANRNANDYVKETYSISADGGLKIPMKSGGGFVLKLEKQPEQ